MTNHALALFNERLPHKPYYSDDLQFGVRIAAKDRAILAKYIQFNQPHAQFWLGFDVDRQGAALDWSDRNAPAPTFTIMNPKNGHAHLLYGLETAIRTAPDGRMKPLKYAAAVENALRKKLDADIGYSGLICQNPNHEHWQVNAWQTELYTLDWLADSLDLTSANDKEIITDYGLGRNCQLFEQTRKWAYRAIRQGWPAYEQWLQACIERTKAYNIRFLTPLDENEVLSVAKSIAKWTYSKFSKASFNEYVIRTHTSEIQKNRGKIGGKISRGGGRPKGSISLNSINSQEKWIELGISRSTYYRRYHKG
ncbi:replication initiation protein [Proteus genomosp. 6]|uniref:replication initiation protein n=1 Tax=Proteus genomosp. 6 TaxID=1311820 RepID=UPI000D68D2BF|nr:replication initiation protein [Proteus genomosp. 6]